MHMARADHEVDGDMVSHEGRKLVEFEIGRISASTYPREETALQLVTLHLARCADYPEGNGRCGYTFVAPLTLDGHLDVGTWHDRRERCYVRRFWQDEPDRVGHLVHRRGGTGGATWCFEYDDVLQIEAERGHHLQAYRFIPGEYISILQDEDELRTFKVADVRKACSR
jgi:hypothetical protein